MEKVGALLGPVLRELARLANRPPGDPPRHATTTDRPAGCQALSTRQLIALIEELVAALAQQLAALAKRVEEQERKHPEQGPTSPHRPPIPPS